MKRLNLRKKAYTLSEVVIVMLIIAVIVGVSIKITKAKLDNIISYTYYSGYSTLKDVSAQIVNNYKSSDTEYTDVAYMKLFPFLNRFSGQKADALTVAKSCMRQDGTSVPVISCSSGKKWVDTPICNCVTSSCTLPSVLDAAKLYCSFHKSFNYSTCSYVDVTPWPPTCPTGQHWKDATINCGCVDDEITPDPPSVCEPTEEEKRIAYCSGKEYNMETCNLQDITPWPPCDNDTEYRWDEETCGCVPISATLPRKGENFCKKFVELANTKAGASECSGDAIDDNLTDFSDKVADITLRNGMRIYNMSHQNPQEINPLKDNIQGGSYDGVPNTNAWGYIIYRDIDGERGPSTLWEDVYRFYVTMSGKVIPAYNMTTGAEETGGNSIHHLMTSVQKEAVDATGHRKLYWISKSVSFKDGACSSGYVGAATSYCSGVSLKNTCSDANGICSLKFISPMKFFQ